MAQKNYNNNFPRQYNNDYNQPQYNEHESNYYNNYDNMHNDYNTPHQADDDNNNYDNYNDKEEYESFTNQSLTDLLKNEITAISYYGKIVSVHLFNNINFKGKLSLISTDSTITFQNIKSDYNYDYNYDKIVSYQHISDIILIENKQHKDYLKSIKHEICDLVKLKMVEYLLYE
eukprot:63486_1